MTRWPAARSGSDIRLATVRISGPVAPAGRRASATEAGRPRTVGELAREPVERAGAGAAPAVDRLARVADGGDRMAAAEQRAAAASPGRGWCPGIRPAARPGTGPVRSRRPRDARSRHVRGPGQLVAEVHRLGERACGGRIRGPSAAAPAAPAGRRASWSRRRTPGRPAPSLGVEPAGPRGQFLRSAAGVRTGRRRGAGRHRSRTSGCSRPSSCRRRTPRTTASAICQQDASVSSRVVGSNPARTPCSADDPGGVAVVGRRRSAPRPRPSCGAELADRAARGAAGCGWRVRRPPCG